METSKANSTNLSAKWAVIYIVTSIVITYVFQLLNLDQASPIKYLSYIPFIAFLFLAQKEYKDKLGGFLKFGEGFMTGFIYSVIAGVFLAIFTYFYLTFLSPQIFEQAMASQEAKMSAQNVSPEQAEKAMEIARKYGTILGAVGILFLTPICGAIISLIGAAIFKRERTAEDVEGQH